MNALEVCSQFGNGQTAAELFSGPYGRTFDDIIILPPFSAGVGKADITLETDLAVGFGLKLPILSSPMDTVTERSTAIQMALHGGLGIIHFNNTPEEAARQVRSVKRYQMGIVDQPVCCHPTDPVSRVGDIKQEYGFSTVLITEDGTPQTRLLGMVTKGHTALAESPQTPLQSVMIPLEELTVCSTQVVRTREDALRFLRRKPAAHKLPILRDDGSVAGLVTRKDVVKHDMYPHALFDPETGQLWSGGFIAGCDFDKNQFLVYARRLFL